MPASVRLGPLVAGLAGLAWFWFELEPQRYGFEDTDNPATGLKFIAAHPHAWQLAGLALVVAAIALVATVVATRDRLEAAAAGERGVGDRTVAVLGVLAAFLLLGHGLTRLAGGPVAYVQGLDQHWGETAYLVTQFIGVQLFAVGGVAMLSVWIVSVAWLGARRGVISRAVALLAVLPALRLLSILQFAGFLPDGLWFLYMAGLPGAFVWLLALAGSGPRSEPVAQPAPAPAAAGAHL